MHTGPRGCVWCCVMFGDEEKESYMCFAVPFLSLPVYIHVWCFYGPYARHKMLLSLPVLSVQRPSYLVTLRSIAFGEKDIGEHNILFMH